MDTKPPIEAQNQIVPFPNSRPRNGDRQDSPDHRAHPQVRGAVRSAHAVAQDEGVSDCTIWRRVKAGLLVQVNIAGRSYITIASLEEFYRRATAGEFAKESRFAK